MTLRAQIPPRHQPVRIIIEIYAGKGWSIKRDIDNAIKPVVDAVKRARIVQDDSVRYVREATARYYPGGGGGDAVCYLTIEDIDQ